MAQPIIDTGQAYLEDARLMVSCYLLQFLCVVLQQNIKFYSLTINVTPFRIKCIMFENKLQPLNFTARVTACFTQSLQFVFDNI